MARTIGAVLFLAVGWHDTGVGIELTCLLNALCPGTGSRGISRSAWAYRQNGGAFESAILSWGSALVHRSPHLFARQRHIEMSDTERCQRVDDRIDHCRDRSMSTGLTDPLSRRPGKTRSAPFVPTACLS